MAWNHYYINMGRLYNPEDNPEDPCIYYNHNVPPHGSVRREWLTIGMKHGSSRISLVEYRKVDDDLDGVWEAYGMLDEPEYSFTVHAEEADPEQLFVYTLYSDGRVCSGFRVDTEAAEAILVFPQPWDISPEAFARAAEKVKNAPSFRGEVEEIVTNELLGGREDVLCLAFFRR